MLVIIIIHRWSDKIGLSHSIFFIAGLDIFIIIAVRAFCTLCRHGDGIVITIVIIVAIVALCRYFAPFRHKFMVAS